MSFLIQKLEKFEPRFSVTLFKALLLGMVATALIIPVAIVAMPFNEFLNGMAAQPKGKAQMTFGRTHDPNGFGKMLERLPVRGTMPRGYTPYLLESLGTEPADLIRAGELIKNPLDTNLANLKAGQAHYSVYCSLCHGAKGHGDGKVTGPGRFPAPPSLHSKQAVEYRDGTLFHVMTKGTKIMPAYADKLETKERWQVALFLRALQRSEDPRAEDLQ